MNTTTITTTRPTARQRRLRAISKRLVIELGYLEHCLAEYQLADCCRWYRYRDRVFK